MSIFSKSLTFSLDVEKTYNGLFRSQEVSVSHKKCYVDELRVYRLILPRMEAKPLGLKMHIGVLKYQDVSPGDRHLLIIEGFIEVHH